MAEFKTDGYVLRVFDYGETSQIAHVLTPEKGNITVLAKGIKRRKRGTPISAQLEPFTKIAMVLHYKAPTSMALLKEFSSIERHQILKSDIRCLGVAGIIFDIIDKSVEPEKRSHRLIDLIDHFFCNLGEPKSKPLTLCTQYLLKLIALLGYEPQLYQCDTCKKKTHLEYFSPQIGATICRECAGSKVNKKNLFPLRPDALSLMRRILKANYAELQNLRLSAQQSMSIIRLVRALCSHHLTMQPYKSWRFFERTAYSDLFTKTNETKK